jgi:hypothetical protein
MTTGDELGVLPAWRGDSPTGAKEAKYFCWRGLDNPDQIELPSEIAGYVGAILSPADTAKAGTITSHSRFVGWSKVP